MIDFFDDVTEYDIELYTNKKNEDEYTISLNSLKELEKYLVKPMIIVMTLFIKFINAMCF